MKHKWEIMQVCVVVRNLEDHLKKYWEVLGIGPWKVRSFNNDIVKEYKVDGKVVDEPFEFRVAITWVGDVELELVEPVKGPNCYWRFLEEKGEGMHHVKAKMTSEEKDDMIAYFESNGYPILQEGWVDRDYHAYPDTQKDLGLMFELGVVVPIELDYEPYPADAVFE